MQNLSVISFQFIVIFLNAYVAAWQETNLTGALSSRPSSRFHSDLTQKILSTFVAKIVTKFCSEFRQVIIFDLKCQLELEHRVDFNVSFVDAWHTGWSFDGDYQARKILDVSGSYQKIQTNEAIYLILMCSRSLFTGPNDDTAYNAPYDFLDRFGLPLRRVVAFEITTMIPDVVSRVFTPHVMFPFVRLLFTNASSPPTCFHFLQGNKSGYFQLFDLEFYFGEGSVNHCDISAIISALNMTSTKRQSEAYMSKNAGYFPYVWFVQKTSNDSNPEWVQIKISHSVLETKVDDQLKSVFGVFHQQRVAFARVPTNNLNLKLICSVFEPLIWLSALAMSLVFHYLRQPKHMLRWALTFVSTISSLWGPFYGPKARPQSSKSRGSETKFFLVMAIWILAVQEISVYMKADILAALHVLPESRVKSVEVCQDVVWYDVREISKNRGLVSDRESLNVLLYGAHYFLRGGVLCQNLELARATRNIILKNVSSYDVRVNTVQYEVAQLDLVVIQGFSPTLGFTFHSLSPGEVLKMTRLVRLVQLELSHALITEPHRTPYADAESALEEFFGKHPLSPTYNNKFCFSTNGDDTMPVIRPERCIQPSDLQLGSAESQVLMKNYFPILLILMCGAALGVWCLMVEVLEVSLLQQRPRCH